EPDIDFEVSIGVDVHAYHRDRYRHLTELKLPQVVRERELNLVDPDRVGNFLVQDLKVESAQRSEFAFGYADHQAVEVGIDKARAESEGFEYRELAADQPAAIRIVYFRELFVQLIARQIRREFGGHRIQHFRDGVGIVQASGHLNSLAESEVRQLKQRAAPAISPAISPAVSIVAFGQRCAFGS